MVIKYNYFKAIERTIAKCLPSLLVALRRRLGRRAAPWPWRQSHTPALASALRSLPDCLDFRKASACPPLARQCPGPRPAPAPRPGGTLGWLPSLQAAVPGPGWPSCRAGTGPWHCRPPQRLQCPRYQGVIGAVVGGQACAQSGLGRVGGEHRGQDQGAIWRVIKRGMRQVWIFIVVRAAGTGACCRTDGFGWQSNGKSRPADGSSVGRAAVNADL